MNLKGMTIYEDEDIIAINKPAGLMVHSDGKTKEETLADILLKEKPEMKEVGEPMEIDGSTIYRPGIVHRLDRDTTGVLIIAKNQKSFEFLKKQFQDHTIKKVYRAIVHGHFKEPTGKINIPIGRSKNDFRKWLAGRGTRGVEREALTLFEVIKEFEHNGQIFSYIELRPQTGRTHQLRVHMKAISHPIVGDQLYGSTSSPDLGLTRQALHAFSIDLSSQNGQPLHLEAGMPADIKGVLAGEGIVC